MYFHRVLRGLLLCLGFLGCSADAQQLFDDHREDSRAALTRWQAQACRYGTRLHLWAIQTQHLLPLSVQDLESLAYVRTSVSAGGSLLEFLSTFINSVQVAVPEVDIAIPTSYIEIPHSESKYVVFDQGQTVELRPGADRFTELKCWPRVADLFLAARDGRAPKKREPKEEEKYELQQTYLHDCSRGALVTPKKGKKWCGEVWDEINRISKSYRGDLEYAQKLIYDRLNDLDAYGSFVIAINVPDNTSGAVNDIAFGLSRDERVFSVSAVADMPNEECKDEELKKKTLAFDSEIFKEIMRYLTRVANALCK